MVVMHCANSQCNTAKIRNQTYLSNIRSLVYNRNAQCTDLRGNVVEVRAGGRGYSKKTRVAATGAQLPSLASEPNILLLIKYFPAVCCS